MKTRISRSQRQRRRRRLVLQLVASIGVSAGAVGYANELDYFADAEGSAELAYYATDPNEVASHVEMVAAQQNLGGPPQEDLEETLQNLEDAPPVPAPVPDAVPADDFLTDPTDLDTLEPPVRQEDVDAIVDGTLYPPRAEESQSPSIVAPMEPTPIEMMQAPQLEPAMVFSGLPSSFAATRASYSAAPSMIGDFFGGSFLHGSLLGATVSLAGGDRRFKVAENVSPIPQDRVFFNYNHFENALVDVNGVTRSLDRYTFGFEKTFLDGLASIETRLPFAGGLDSTQIDGNPDTQATEFGNLAFALKANLLSGDCWMLSAGTSVVVPTGDDYEVFVGGSQALLIENDAVHMGPFLGYVTQPNNRWFAQGFIQADFDLNGNDVISNGNTFEGVLQDQNLLFIDASIGRWIHRNCDPCARVSAVAAIAELHYTTTLNDTDGVSGISNPFNRMDILNATGALNFQLRKSSLRVGAAAPLTQDEESLFDAEIIVQFNRYF